MHWQQIGYALACVLVPITWGLIIVGVSNRMDRRLIHERRGEPRPIEYHI